MTLVTTAPAPRVLADVLPKSRLNDAILIALGATVIGLGAQLAITTDLLSSSAVTFQAFAVLIVAASLGAIRGTLAVILYGGLALVGMPWLAFGETGFNPVGTLTPMFGYLLGFVAAAALVGYLAERGWTRKPIDTALAMILGSTLIYAGGVLWLHFAAGATWNQAITLGMTTFLLSDVIKIGICAAIFPYAWKHLVKANRAPAEHMDRKRYHFEEPVQDPTVEVAVDITDSAEVAETAGQDENDDAVIDLTGTAAEASDAETVDANSNKA